MGELRAEYEEAARRGERRHGDGRRLRRHQEVLASRILTGNHGQVLHSPGSIGQIWKKNGATYVEKVMQSSSHSDVGGV